VNKVQKTALSYVLAILLLAYGYAVGRFEVFPHALLEKYATNFEQFAAGDPLEKKTSVTDKLLSDLGMSYARWAYPYPELAAAGTHALKGDAFGNREAPLYFVDDAHRAGYRVIIGAFDLADGTFWGGVMVDGEGEVLHTWSFSTEYIEGAVQDRLKNLYGVHVFPDGSVIFNMGKDSGGIVKVDACSNVVWTLRGDYHHAVSPDEHGNFWTFVGLSEYFNQDMELVSIATGKKIRRIKMEDVRAANPDLHIWNLGGLGNRYAKHATHGNDIDPLPAAVADQYPGLEAGDLVISYAATNLIFILDPDSLKVKWWRIGTGDFQHDPDWEPGGKITLYSNNNRSEKTVSDIVTLDYATKDDQIILRGEAYDFYSNANGRHQLTPYGTRMVTSSKQGWVFEVDADGKIVSSFVNNINSEKALALHLSEAWRFDENYFTDKFWLDCDA